MLSGIAYHWYENEAHCPRYFCGAAVDGVKVIDEAFGGEAHSDSD